MDWMEEEEVGKSFLSHYNHPKKKKKNGGTKKTTPSAAADGGNFTAAGPNGDIVVTTSISCHARERIKERGISIGDALKGKQKSGAVLSDDGKKVITVIPDSWKKNAGTLAQCKKPSKIPKDENFLPEGHCMASIDIPSNVCGLILGAQHANIRKMTAKYPHTQYEMKNGENKMCLWGPEDQVKALTKDIEARVNQVMNNERTNPPVPEGKLPPGHIKRHWIIGKRNISTVIGKGGQTLAKLRKEHPAASIHINGQTGQTYIFGEATEVNIVCDEIASITSMANKIRAQENAWKEKRAKSSPHTSTATTHDKKKDSNRITKEQRKAVKPKQKRQEEEELSKGMTATELKIFWRAKMGNKKAKKKMEKHVQKKQKEKEGKKQTQQNGSSYY